MGKKDSKGAKKNQPAPVQPQEESPKKKAEREKREARKALEAQIKDLKQKIRDIEFGLLDHKMKARGERAEVVKRYEMEIGRLNGKLSELD